MKISNFPPAKACQPACQAKRGGQGHWRAGKLQLGNRRQRWFFLLASLKLPSINLSFSRRAHAVILRAHAVILADAGIQKKKQNRFLVKPGMTSRRQRLFFLLAAMAILLPMFYLVNKYASTTKATWYDDSYAYRKKITIGNSGSAISTARKVLIEVDTAALTTDKMQADCDDTRFTDINGKVLRHFIDTDSGACDTSSTDFYVELTSVTTGDNIIYMYYGNPSATSNRSAEFFAPDAYSSLGNKLKGNWALDETSGTRYDTGKGNELTDNATVTSATGKVGNAGDFEQDTSEYLSKTDNADLSTGTSDYTVAMWIKPESISATSNQDLMIARKWGSDVADQEWNLRVRSGASPSIKMEVLSSVSSGGTIAAGTWYFVVATVDYDAVIPSVSFTGYIDNVQKITGSSGGTAGRDGAAEFQIGGYNPATGEGLYYDGLIDNFMFWKRILTADERTALYNSGNGLGFGVVSFTPTSGPTLASEEKTPGPAAYWKFDDGQGTTAQDSTVNNNDGTLGTGSSAPTWTEESRCVSGKCLQFDGTNDVVTVSNTVAGIQSVSFWVRPTTTSEQFVDLNGSAYIQSSSGTISATGFTSPTIYVNGVVSSTITANTWQYITVTTGTALTGSAIKIAQVSTNYGQGFIDEPKIYPYARSAAQIKADFVKGSSAKGGNVLGLPATSALADGLVGYWKMDESAANTCTGGVNDSCDSSGNGKDGAWTNQATTSTTAKFGRSVTFDGTSDYVTMGDVLDFERTEPFSLGAWVKSASGASVEFVVTKWDNQVNGAGYGFTLGTNGKVNFHLANDQTTNTIDLTGSVNVRDDTWHHVLVSYDGSSRASGVNIFTDGVKNSITTTNDTLTATTIGTDSFQLGCREDCSFSYFSGQMDEVRVYNRALSGGDAQLLYNFAPGPVGHWKMDEKTGTSATDSSSYGNTGTLGTGSSAPTWSTGKFGSALSFDGTDDYVNLGTPSSLDAMLTGSSSVSGWFKTSESGTKGIISRGDNYGAEQNSYWIIYWVGSTNKVLFAIRENLPSEVSANITSTNSFSDDTWIHFTAVRNYGGTNYLYVNGILEGSVADIGVPITFSATRNNVIGGHNIGASGAASYLSGLIDDTKIYNYARTSKQIVEDMNAGHPAGGSPVGSAVGYWKLDEGQGITANNAGNGGSALNGTLTTMASPATATSGWTNSGKFGKGLMFDGSNDYVSSARALTSTSYSISAWINPSRFGTDNQLNGIVYQGTGSSDLGTRFGVGTCSVCGVTNGNTQTLFFENGGGAAYLTAPNNSVSLSSWQHVVLTKDGANENLYINGKVVSSRTNGNTTTPSSNNTYVGLWYNTADSNRFFQGTIDEVKIYNGALTAEEVKIDYNQGASIKLGSLSTDSTGTVAAFDAAREYCVPGDTTSCAAPVGEWKMDEGTGTSANDTSGNGFTGTLGTGSSAPTWISGKIGKGLSFDGTNDFIQAGDILDSTFAGSNKIFTIESWIKPGTSSLTSNTFVSKIADSNCSENQRQLLLRLLTGSKVEFTWYGALDGSSYRGTLGSTAITNINRWYHVTAVYDGTQAADSRVTLYVDGVKETTSIDLTAGSPTSIADGTAYFGLGSRVSSSGTACEGTNYFNGSIDDVKIYNYARTAAQVAWDYNRGGPVARYKLDECQGPTAYSTNDPYNSTLNGTLTIGASGTQTAVGDCASGTSTHAWYNGATGKFNSSLNFDGTDDYVSINGLATQLASTTQGTISFWLRPVDATPSSIDTPFMFGHTTQNRQVGRIDITTAGRLTANNFDISADDWVLTTTDPVLSDGTWTHVVLVQNGTSPIIYVNGVSPPQSFTTSTDKTAWFSSTSGMNEGSIGRFHNFAADTQYFTGQIDDVQIFNYALSATQIKNVMNDGSAVRWGPNTGAP